MSGIGLPGMSNREIVHVLRARSTAESTDSLPSDFERDLARGGGRPLPTVVREPLETGLGRSLEQVRVHTGSNAADLATGIGAEAFTVGSDVYFGPGRFRPDTNEGYRLIAHEATHVMQAGTSVDALAGPLVLGSSNAAAETEADTLANQLAAQYRTGAPNNRGMSSNGSQVSALVVRRQGRGDRGVEEGRAEGRETRTSRAFEDDSRRGRPPGGDGRARRADLFSHFESDWAGRAILERYLSGEGDWDIRDDDRWTSYLKRSLLLRGQLRLVALDVARRLESANKDGQFAVHETFHAGLENGEGIIGYQYLHGTNKNVGDFDISGSADVIHLYGQSYEGQNTSEQSGTTINMRLQFVWNDMIDPNSNYTSDIIKSAIAEIITIGEAESYRISIGWHDESQIWLPETGGQVLIGYPGP
jgi:hypothetical protein